jgi:FAD-dependent oxidoreductase domain-containing protein 1
MDDVVVIGGGIIGAATAYFLSKEGRKVKVIERDPTYKTASFPLSLGGFRRQFFQRENILLGKFAREFIYQIPELLKTQKNPNPTASMVTNGYLLMFGPEHAEEQYRALENHKECDAGTKNIKGSELSKVFPYVNNEGIETATYTDNQSEGWIDPLCSIALLKVKLLSLVLNLSKVMLKVFLKLTLKQLFQQLVVGQKSY